MGFIRNLWKYFKRQSGNDWHFFIEKNTKTRLIITLKTLRLRRSIVRGSILIIKLLLQTMNIKEKFRFKVKVLLEQKLMICLIILAKSHLVI